MSFGWRGELLDEDITRFSLMCNRLRDFLGLYGTGKRGAKENNH